MTPFRWLLAGLSFAAAIAVSLYIVFTSWPHERAVSVPPLAHLLLLVVSLLELAARAGKMHFSAASLRFRMSFGTGLRASAGGDFGAAITPWRTGAEPARYLIMTEAGMHSAAILLIIYAELFLEMLSLAVVAAAMFLVFRNSGSQIMGMVGLVALYAAFVLGGGAILVVLARRRSTGPPPQWAERIGLHAGRWRAIQRGLRQLREGIEGIRDLRLGAAAASLLCSILHIALRLAILPIIVYAFGERPPIAPLILWPIALTYGSVLAPMPGGGGVIEVAFKFALGSTIPPHIFGASLIWWRFYTFYFFILLGALAAGGTVLRALREAKDDELPLPDEADGQARAAGPGLEVSG
ncbi:MAG TPA: lysylphosphatidylglycerol synthase transmembrane domain-containing protein [Gemmatimonadaceae bacterium]|nr:lysylphosphatidylglycerol synthase transmembrane domain-containing protein [Gemmatimonadaceae bacterium]